MAVGDGSEANIQFSAAIRIGDIEQGIVNIKGGGV